MNKLINIILTAALWRNYKFMIISVLVLIASVFVVGLIHDDYLQWAQYQLTQSNGSVPVSIGWSFVVKYVVYIAAIVMCFYANKWVNNKKAMQKAEAGEDNTVLKRILSFKRKVQDPEQPNQPLRKKQTHQGQGASTSPNVNKDVFANIRNKPKLRSQADIVIDNKQHTKP